jgi:hypothetical protein
VALIMAGRFFEAQEQRVAVPETLGALSTKLLRRSRINVSARFSLPTGSGCATRPAITQPLKTSMRRGEPAAKKLRAALLRVPTLLESLGC